MCLVIYVNLVKVCLLLYAWVLSGVCVKWLDRQFTIETGITDDEIDDSLDEYGRTDNSVGD